MLTTFRCGKNANREGGILKTPPSLTSKLQTISTLHKKRVKLVNYGKTCLYFPKKGHNSPIVSDYNAL